VLEDAAISLNAHRRLAPQAGSLESNAQLAKLEQALLVKDCFIQVA